MEDTMSENTSSVRALDDDTTWPPVPYPLIATEPKEKNVGNVLTGNSTLDFFVGLSIPILSCVAAVLYDSRYGLVNLQGHVLMLGAVAVIALPSLAGHMTWTMLPNLRHLRSNSVAAGSWTSLVLVLAAFKLLGIGSHPSGCLPLIGNTISMLTSSHISSSLWMR